MAKQVNNEVSHLDRTVLVIRKNKKDLFTQKQIQSLAPLQFSNDIIAELTYKICREGAKLDKVTKD